MHPVAFRARGQIRPYLTLSSYLRCSLWRRPGSVRAYATAQLDLPGLDGKWRQRWGEKKPLEPDSQPASESAQNMYILAMFPYPSGKLHLGHLRVYTIADVIARYYALQGRNVLYPMGWDAFGLPAENAAIERGIDPAEWTTDNIARMKEQLQLMNASFDWTREISTCDPEFYKHTQKIFLLFREHGLVQRKKATVNWDPVEKTVLANEQVDADGRSWRSGAVVEQRELEQWFLQITKFAFPLNKGLDKLGREDGWPERVLAMQRNWIGRTEGAEYQFPISPASESKVTVDSFKVFTTRPETIFAAQFIAISPNSQLADEYAKEDPYLRKFLDRAKSLPHNSTDAYRLSQAKAINPLSLLKDTTWKTLAALPVYVAPYVRGDYGTGAVMGVPAHDARDFAFWQRHHRNEPIKYAITNHEDGSIPTGVRPPFVIPGYMTNHAGRYQGEHSKYTANRIVHWMFRYGQRARTMVQWKLRDWLISRQRYWGTPIPIIHCDNCGAQPVPDDQLPVKLPRVDYHWADGRTGNPLETATDWVNTTCPKCRGPAKRDTDTMDTFMDSSWYYMRFPDPHNPDWPISSEAAEQYLPVDIYVGGVEHAILHLLYARFVYRAVMGFLSSAEPDEHLKTMLTTQSKKEPFKRLITQGMVHGKTYSDPDSGRFLKPDEVDLSDPSSPKIVASGKKPSVSFEKMSKSKHNGVDPVSFIAKYGADATRAHILFQAPVGDVLNWDEGKIAGVTRWLRRVHDLVQSLASAEKRADWKAEEHFNKTATAAAEDSEVAADKDRAAQHAIDAEVWRTTQNTIISVSESMQKVYALNTAVSDLMNLTNVLIKNSAAASEPVKVAATETLLYLLAPIAPAVAEECWSVLYPSSSSSQGGIFGQGNQNVWPTPDGTLSLLQEDTIQCAVQVDGKLRCVVEIPAAQPSGGAPDEFERWVTEEILKNPGAWEKLVFGAVDIRNAVKVIPVNGGKVVNYVMGKKGGRSR